MVFNNNYRILEHTTFYGTYYTVERECRNWLGKYYWKVETCLMPPDGFQQERKFGTLENAKRFIRQETFFDTQKVVFSTKNKNLKKIKKIKF